MNFILKILEYFESRKEVSVVRDLEIDDYDNHVNKYYLRIMYHANLLAAEEITSSTTKKRLIEIWPFELSWEGHDFLTSIRNKSVLKKIKARIGTSIRMCHH